MDNYTHFHTHSYNQSILKSTGDWLGEQGKPNVIINQLNQSYLILNLENWDWVECQLGNIAKRVQQFNLHGEKRKSGRKKRVKKEEKGEKREREGVEKRVIKEKIEKQR